MNIATMRQAIADAYPRRGWRSKVATMNDEQVLAIYKSMERDGRLYQHAKKQENDERRINAAIRAFNHNGPFAT